MEKKENWEIVLTRPAEKVYDKSSKEIKARLDRCFEELERNPLYGNNIKPLTGKLKGLYRYRVGDWRVIYRLFLCLTINYKDKKRFSKVNRTINIIVLLVFLFFAMSALLQAKENKYAVIIGIGKYEDKQIRRLKYTRADAKAVYDFLVDRDGGNFPKDNVRLLLDEEASQVNIRSALGTFLSRSALKDDTVFIYYAGHGAFEVDRTKQEPDGYAKYIVPYNANSKDLFATAIPMNEIETIFRMIVSLRG